MRWLGLALLALIAANMSQASELKVKSAWRSGENLLVELEAGKGLESGNRFFWGTRQGLQQLELTWDSSAGGSRAIDFEGPGEHWIDLSAKEASLHCNGKVESLAPLAKGELAGLQDVVSFLPEVKEPLFLFQRSKADEYIAVIGQRFNWSGRPEIHIGKPGRWRRVETVVRGDWRNEPPGKFSFAIGGGLYVPTEIDLFKEGRDPNRKAMLVLGASAIEELRRPALARSEVERIFASLSARRAPARLIKTPCS